MNSGISILFKAIPLAMAVFCFAFGTFIYQFGGGGSRIMAGLVIIASGMVCITLFCNTEIITRQIEQTYTRNIKYILLIISYLTTIIAIFCGIYLFVHPSTSSAFVTGHTVAGMGLVSACMATAATASTRFNLLLANSKNSENEIPAGTFSLRQERILEAIVIVISFIAWGWAFLLMINSHTHPVYFVAGHIMAGIACICTSYIAVIATIVRQIRNVYTEKERVRWLELALMMGSISIIWGIYIAYGDVSIANGVSGYIMIGLGLVCYCILGKIAILERAWKRHFNYSNLFLLIPVLAATVCFLLSISLFEFATISSDYIIPARILAALGGICFSFISILSFLTNKVFSKE